MTNHSFPRHVRLLTAGDYSFVFSDPSFKIHSPSLMMLARLNPQGFARCGVIAAKKNIKTAVGRNRIKRLVRESFRLHQHELPHLDIVVMTKKGINEQPSDILNTMLLNMWDSLNYKYSKSLGSKRA